MILSSLAQSPAGRWTAVMFFVTAWYALLWLLGLWLFDVAPEPRAIPRDLAANLLLGSVLYAAARSPARFAVAMAVLMAALQLSNAGKVAVLGGPIMPDDFWAARNLFLLLEGWQLTAAVAIVAVPAGLLFLAVAWRSPGAWGVAALLVTVSVIYSAYPQRIVHAMDASFGNVVWNQRGNFETRGLLIHLAQETARYLDRASRSPSATEVQAALAVVQPGRAVPSGLTRQAGPSLRNVHMIVLESFWDPVLLTASSLSQDPLDPEFRALWAAAGHSHALSPVFGGYTANAEFEVLCGFPVTEDSVFFEGGLRRHAPCLPEHLSAAGYHAVASHPNSAVFWNRLNAYDRIGFDTYWAKSDFVLDDMNRNYLSDASLYRQVMDKIDTLLAGGTPVFNYILTYFGHLDYPLNERRPSRVAAAEAGPLVSAYANTMYYKSRELMAFLKVLREKDPDGLVVLFGDHLPFLGPNFAGFTESGLLTDNRSTLSDEMLLTLVATPLVVIDGRRGPVRLGNVSMHELPALILELLHDPTPSLLRLAASGDGVGVRPLPGMYLAAGASGVRFACRGERLNVTECGDTDRWLAAVVTLRKDLFSGDQHVLRAMPGLFRDQSVLSTTGAIVDRAGAR